MAALIRMVVSIVVSAFIAKIVDRLVNPKSKSALHGQGKAAPLPALDLKPCPVCGIYTAQPKTHCPQ